VNAILADFESAAKAQKCPVSPRSSSREVSKDAGAMYGRAPRAGA